MAYQDLNVWRKGMDLAEQIYQITDQFPAAERFSLTDQMKRAAISIPSNIAEGNERESFPEHIRFFSYAKGSAAELETQLLLCVRIGYLSESQITSSLSLCSDIKKMLSAMILSLNEKSTKNKS